MAHVEIYTLPHCPYCHMAKEILDKRGVQYTEIDVAEKPDIRRKMTERADGAKTLPQIFIDDRHVGGCDDLIELNLGGELDAMLDGKG